MHNDGKGLEALVALIETLHLPEGFSVTTNERVYSEGIQIAEFDIEIKGRLGTTDIAWLIECRDRPADGPAPGSWIEQLVGRRSRFKFNKITAVSTTGFAAGAVEFAGREEIELREVEALAPNQFADWLRIASMTKIEHSGVLHNASLIIESDEKERREALLQALSNKRLTDTVLRFVETNEMVSAVTAFSAAVSENQTLYDHIEPNQSGKRLELRVSYPHELRHFSVGTQLGPIRINEILFSGQLTVNHTEVPLMHTTEYRNLSSGESISQSATFEFEALNHQLSLEMHKLTGSSGETRIVLRKVGE